MKFLSVRDLRSKSAEVWKGLTAEREMVVTSNGRPIAILSAVTEENLEETLAAIRRSRAVAAVSEIQRRSIEQGTTSSLRRRSRPRSRLSGESAGSGVISRDEGRLGHERPATRSEVYYTVVDDQEDGRQRGVAGAQCRAAEIDLRSHGPAQERAQILSPAGR